MIVGGKSWLDFTTLVSSKFFEKRSFNKSRPALKYANFKKQRDKNEKLNK